MQLDYNPGRESYILRVQRGEADVKALMREHGLDFSTPASTADEAVLFTREPYAAVTFFDSATERARNNLAKIKAEIDESWKASSDRHIAVPPDKELWGFQKANVEYALRRTNTLIGDQPGLGKTPTAIAYCNEIQAERALVICPANIRLQWAKRIREWTTMRWPYHVYPILTSRNGTHPTAEWTVVSYDLARTEAIGKALAKERYDVLILDEPHYLKETSTKRTRAIFGGGKSRLFDPLAERCDHILGLTGTPLPNRPREAYTLARGMCWDSIDWMSEQHFQDRFNPSLMIERVDPETGETKRFVDERSGRHYELQNRLRGNFMTRHVKHGPMGVMSQLKMPIYDLIQVEETGAIKQALAAESLLDIDPEELEGADAQLLGHISVVRRMMGVAMAPQVADYVEMLLDGGEEKLVVFAWHIEVLDILERRLGKHGVVRIDGRTSAMQKDKLVERFVKDENIHFCIGNMLSMGVGTDGLQQVCNHGLIAEPDWVPGNNLQAFDRLDRGGQNWQVQGDIFVAPGSVAEKVLATALRKNQVIHKSLDHQIGGEQ
jgi:SNF2 family DNA or RNA helicase